MKLTLTFALIALMLSSARAQVIDWTLCGIITSITSGSTYDLSIYVNAPVTITFQIDTSIPALSDNVYSPSEEIYDGLAMNAYITYGDYTMEDIYNLTADSTLTDLGIYSGITVGPNNTLSYGYAGTVYNAYNSVANPTNDAGFSFGLIGDQADIAPNTSLSSIQQYAISLFDESNGFDITDANGSVNGTFTSNIVTFASTAPEPSTLTVLIGGLGLCACLMRRRFLNPALPLGN